MFLISLSGPSPAELIKIMLLRGMGMLTDAKQHMNHIDATATSADEQEK